MRRGKSTAAVAGQYHIGRLVEQCAEPPVAAFGDAAGVVDLAGLITPRDQAQISARVARMSEAIGIYGRTNPERFDVRGYIEEGTTTTPFDMVVLNNASRYHLCIEALRRVAGRYRPVGKGD